MIIKIWLLWLGLSSFCMFPCSKYHSVRLYLDTFWIILQMIWLNFRAQVLNSVGGWLLFGRLSTSFWWIIINSWCIKYFLCHIKFNMSPALIIRNRQTGKDYERIDYQQLLSQLRGAKGSHFKLRGVLFCTWNFSIVQLYVYVFKLHARSCG